MKTMKKSMFITTIMMVVLLVVALSTATFAWYTAQSSVSVTSTSVSSASSNSASLVIDTAAAGIDASNSSITLTTSQSIAPMIYHSASDPTTDVTYEAFMNNSFYTCVVDNDGNLVNPASATTAGQIDTVTGSGEAKSQNYFVLTNVGGTSLGSLKITVNTTHYSFVAKVVEAGGSTTGLYETNDGLSGRSERALIPPELLRLIMSVKKPTILTLPYSPVPAAQIPL